MKFRQGFVSNSSSSSFVIIGKEVDNQFIIDNYKDNIEEILAWMKSIKDHEGGSNCYGYVDVYDGFNLISILDYDDNLKLIYGKFIREYDRGYMFNETFTDLNILMRKVADELDIENPSLFIGEAGS